MCHPESSAQVLDVGFDVNQTLQQLISVISSPSLPAVFKWNKSTQMAICGTQITHASL